MKRTSFHNEVAEEARGKAAPVLCRSLRESSNLDQWHTALVDLHQDIEQQTTERKTALDEEHTRCLEMGEHGKLTYFDARNVYQKWRQGAGRFKQAIDQRLREVKTLRRKRGESKSENETWDLLKRAALLIPKEGDGIDWHERFARIRISET